jgi:hypothetical protein
MLKIPPKAGERETGGEVNSKSYVTTVKIDESQTLNSLL